MLNSDILNKTTLYIIFISIAFSGVFDNVKNWYQSPNEKIIGKWDLYFKNSYQENAYITFNEDFSSFMTAIGVGISQDWVITPDNMLILKNRKSTHKKPGTKLYHITFENYDKFKQCIGAISPLIYDFQLLGEYNYNIETLQKLHELNQI